MKSKVVMQFELRMGAADRIREVADVTVDPSLENVEGADIIVAGGYKFDGAFMDRVGPSLKLIAKPGIGPGFRDPYDARVPDRSAWS